MSFSGPVIILRIALIGVALEPTLSQALRTWEGAGSQAAGCSTPPVM